MASPASSTRNVPRKVDLHAYDLKVSTYDRVSSFLVSALILLGVAVGALVVIWFTNKVFVRHAAVPVVMENIGGGVESGVVGESMMIDAPDIAEVAREAELPDPHVPETLAAITDAVGMRSVQFDDPALTEDWDEGGGGRSIGDGRIPGKGVGNGQPGVPRAQRWEITFPKGNTLGAYARQLDFFGIELAAIGVGRRVDYVTDLAQKAPKKRAGAGQDEQRLYMSWRQSDLAEADRELLSKAGVPTEGKIIVQFIPPNLENTLAQLELDYRDRAATEIRKTHFALRGTRDNYEFYVTDQTYL